MTDEMMDLRSIVEKAFDADLLRSCSSRMTNGRSIAPATSDCPLWSSDQPGPRPDIALARRRATPR